MSLISCPECNKEVSDTAKSCPHCGYNIEKYITDSRKVEVTSKVSETSVPKNNSKTGVIIAIVAIILIAIISVFVIKQKKQDEYALMNLDLLVSHTEDIQEYRAYAVMEIDGKYYYHDAGASQAVAKISQRLSNLDICIEYIDEHYSESKSAIDEEIEKITSYSCRTWDEYRERLNTNYYIDADMTNNERAEEIVSRYADRMVD